MCVSKNKNNFIKLLAKKAVIRFWRLFIAHYLFYVSRILGRKYVADSASTRFKLAIVPSAAINGGAMWRNLCRWQNRWRLFQGVLQPFFIECGFIYEIRFNF